MDNSKSPAGYTSIKKLVILAQTDTTVGFLSQNQEKLSSIKNRPPSKPYLKNFFSLKTLKQHLRVPKEHKKAIRRAKKTTFIVKNQAFRVAKPKVSSKIYDDLKWCYSTSANKSGFDFDESFAKEMADIIIIDCYGLKENPPSCIIKLNSKKRLKLR
jgi:tRNA A37 threonylcarbamoyladenosine synthetase subunit TsaC/SUA5/YrdC